MLLCGGAINSPQILQLSGIGPGALLQSLGIDVKHDLPGVGENLQDHIGGRIIHRCVDGTVTMNEIYHNWLRRLQAGLQYVLCAEGPADDRRRRRSGLFVKTRPELDTPDVQYQFLAGSAEQDRRADAPLPRLHAGRHPVPPGEPRLAAHQLARSRRSRRRCSPTTCPPSATRTRSSPA